MDFLHHGLLLTFKVFVSIVEYFNHSFDLDFVSLDIEDGFVDMVLLPL